MIPIEERFILHEKGLLLHENPASIKIAIKIKTLDVTAVFGATDYLSVGLMKGLANVGVRIPNEISIHGVTNVEYGLITTPTLSSIDFSPDLAAKNAMELINVMKLKNRNVYRNVEISFKIVERNTVANI